jgi:CheY-like chemotaxis protein
MRPTPVLYVEDEDNDAFFMRLGFESTSITTPLEVVTDGQQALQYLAGEGPYADREKYPFPCLVLLDLNLPMVSGFEVLSWIRRQPAMDGLPVIIFSSSSQPQDQQRVRDLGADAYLVKPVNMGRLDEMLGKLKTNWLDQIPACVV